MRGFAVLGGWLLVHRLSAGQTQKAAHWAAFCVCLAERGTASAAPNETQPDSSGENFSTGFSGLATPRCQFTPRAPKGSKH